MCQVACACVVLMHVSKTCFVDNNRHGNDVCHVIKCSDKGNMINVELLKDMDLVFGPYNFFYLYLHFFLVSSLQPMCPSERYASWTDWCLAQIKRCLEDKCYTENAEDLFESNRECFSEDARYQFSIRVDDNYDLLVRGKEKWFVQHITHQLSKILQVPKSCIENLTITKGSIFINFTTTPRISQIGDIVMHDITGRNMKISEVITSETVSEETRKDELEQYPTNKLFVAKRNAPFEPLSTDVGQLSDTNKFIVNRKVKNDPVFENKVSSIRNKEDIFDRRSYDGKDFVYFTLIPPVSLSIKGKKQFISNTDKSNTIASFNDSFIISSDFYNATTLPSVEFGVNSDNNVNINIKHTSRKDLSTQNKNTSYTSSHSNNFAYFIKDKSQRKSAFYNNSTIVSSTFGSNNISTEFITKFKNLNVIDATLRYDENVTSTTGFNIIKRFDHDSSEIANASQTDITDENVALENATLDNNMMLNNTDGLENLTRYSDDILVDVNTITAEVINDSDDISITSKSIPVDDRNENASGLTEIQTHYNDINDLIIDTNNSIFSQFGNFTSGDSNITLISESFDVTNEFVTSFILFSSTDQKDEPNSSLLQSTIIDTLIDTFTPFVSAINETLSFDNSSRESDMFQSKTYISDVNGTFSFDGENNVFSSSSREISINSSKDSEYETSYLSEAVTDDIIFTSNTIFIINDSKVFSLRNMHANQNSDLEIAPTASPSITENLFINSTAHPTHSFTFDNTDSFPDADDTYLFFGMNDTDSSSTRTSNDWEEQPSSLLTSITLSYLSDIILSTSTSVYGSKTFVTNYMHEKTEIDQNVLFSYSTTYLANFFIYKSTTSLNFNETINEMSDIFNSLKNNFLSKEYYTLNSPSFEHSTVSENAITSLDRDSVFEDYQTSQHTTLFSFLSSVNTYPTSTFGSAISVMDISEMFIFYNNQTHSISPSEYDHTVTFALSVSSLSSTDSTASLPTSLPDNMHEILSSFRDSEDDSTASLLLPNNPSASSTALPIVNFIMSASTTSLSDASKFLYDIFSSSNIYTSSRTDTTISLPYITSSSSIYSVNMSDFNVFPIENQVVISTFPETLSSTSPIKDDRTKHIRFPINPGQTNRKFTQRDTIIFDSSRDNAVDSDDVKPTKSYFFTSEHSMVSTYDNQVYDKEIILSNQREMIPELSSTDVYKLTSIASREMFNFKEDNSVLRSMSSTMDDLQSSASFRNSVDSDKTVSTLDAITTWFLDSSSEELDSVLVIDSTRASIILYKTETVVKSSEETIDETITSSYRPESVIPVSYRLISTTELAIQTIKNSPLSTLENYSFLKSTTSSQLPNIYYTTAVSPSIFNVVSSFDGNESDLTTFIANELSRFDKITTSTPIVSDIFTLKTSQELFSKNNDLEITDVPEAQFSLRRPTKDVDSDDQESTANTAILTSFELFTTPTLETQVTSIKSSNFMINSEQIISSISDLELVSSSGPSEPVLNETTPYDPLASMSDTEHKFSSQYSTINELKSSELTTSTINSLVSFSENESEQILENFYTTETRLQSSIPPVPSTTFISEFNGKTSSNMFKNSHETSLGKEFSENTAIYLSKNGKSSIEMFITSTPKIETEESFTELSENSMSIQPTSNIGSFSTVSYSSMQELIEDTPTFSKKVSGISSETAIIAPSRTTNISPTAFIKSANKNSNTLQTESVNVKTQNIPSSVLDEDKITDFSTFTKPITDGYVTASLFTSPSYSKSTSRLQDTFTKSVTTESPVTKSESRKITDSPLNKRSSTGSINDSKDEKQSTILPVSNVAFSSTSSEEESTSFTPIPYVEIPVHFKINADFKEVVGTREAQFKKSLKRQLAKIMRLPLDTIQNLTVTEGSVQVNFHLVPSSSSGYPADEEVLKAASEELKRLINNNQLKLKDLNGNTLVVVAENPITTPAPVSPPDNTTTILGVILAIVLLIAIITFTAIMTKYRGTQKLSPLEEAKNDIPSYRKIPYENLLWAMAKPNAPVGKFDYDSGVWMGPGSPPVFQAPEIPKYVPPTKSQIRKSVRPSTSTRRKLKQDWDIDDQTLLF